jgi:hypothetical protein
LRNFFYFPQKAFYCIILSFSVQIIFRLFKTWEHAVAQLAEALRYSRKVAGSISDGVIGIFH